MNMIPLLLFVNPNSMFIWVIKCNANNEYDFILSTNVGLKIENGC